MWKFRLRLLKKDCIKPYAIEQLLKRIARVIDFTGTIFYIKESSKWQVGTSNDWWLEQIGDRIIEVRYRYGDKHPDEMQALKTTLMWLVNLKDGDDKPKEQTNG